MKSIMRILRWLDRAIDRAAFQGLTDSQYEQLCRIFEEKHER